MVDEGQNEGIQMFFFAMFVRRDGTHVVLSYGCVTVKYHSETICTCSRTNLEYRVHRERTHYKAPGTTLCAINRNIQIHH